MRRVMMAVLLISSAVFAQSPQPDWSKANTEMLQFLTALVRIDTTNGNETAAAQYVKGVLDREGIASEVFERVPGRGNIVARLKGSGKKQPVLLMAHLDTVPVERDKWTVDPFGGEVKDGYVYGRGAADDKDNVAASLELFLLLHRLKVPLDRDIILLFESGEEAQTDVGIEFVIAQHWDKIAAEFAITEGPFAQLENGKVKWVGISTTEKVPRAMTLEARGTSGHASIPRVDDPVTHLAAAVAKLGDWRTPMRLNDTTRAFFAGLAKISDAQDAWAYTHLDDPKAQQYLLEHRGEYYAMLRTTVVPTIIKGGFRENVIPGNAGATVDIRALPDEDIDAFRARMRELVNDKLVTMKPLPSPRPPGEPSRLDTELYRAFEAATKQIYPGVPMLPVEVPFATDMAFLRAKGVQSYGFDPPAPPTSVPEGPRMHGNDERISVVALDQYLRFFYASIVNVAVAK
ncbi:MAG: M20/M25/M40 family metallo-hydrolase [Terriglobales bacterium]